MPNQVGQFINTNPSLEDTLGFLGGRIQNPAGANFGQQGIDLLGGNLIPKLGAFGGPSTQVGLANLFQILSQQGKTDPRLFNQNQAAIARGTEGRQQNIQQSLAQLGLQGSGLGQALSQAAGGGGQALLAQNRAQEAALAEQRKRSDLDLLLRLIIDPTLQSGALATGQFNADRGLANQQSAANDAQTSQYLALLASFFA